MLLKAMRKADGTYRTYDEMVAENIPTKYSGKWVASVCSDCDLQTGQGKPFSCYMYGAFIPEVEVNLETGKVKIEKMTVVGDYGTIMNKLVVDGQIYGGVTQAMGLARAKTLKTTKNITHWLVVVFHIQMMFRMILNCIMLKHHVQKGLMVLPAAAKVHCAVLRLQS